MGSKIFSVMLALSCVLGAGTMQGEVRLPALISDHMVVQQKMPVRIWGWAAPGEDVSVTFHGEHALARGDEDGNWQVLLGPFAAGPASNLTVKGSNTIVVHDVLVGEVWLASGQSNMSYPVTSLHDDLVVKNANHPAMRLFRVADAFFEQPKDDVRGHWEVCSPQTAATFSAVGYFFGREILEHKKVPVGVIEAAVGGTPIEGWTSEATLKSDSSLSYFFDEYKKWMDAFPAADAKYQASEKAWEADHPPTGDNQPPAKGRPAPPPGPRWRPGGLYNGIIAPLTQFSLRGVIWYQGEWNARDEQHAWIYRRVFPMMIESWREAWGRDDMPFYWVQLPNLDTPQAWAILRESQAKALELRHTAMAVTIDVGDPHSLHPSTNKLPAGQRLALAARALTYGEKVEYSGPVLRQAMRDDAGIRLWFDHAANLHAKGSDHLVGFEVAGSNHQFVPANARIDKDSIIISAKGVAEPEAVRYAWGSNPEGNLTNTSGLPASPFRTKEW